MATKDVSVDSEAYSSTARKTLVLGKDGASMASVTNPLPVDAVVTVDSMTVNAEMKVETGHDFYITTTNLGDDTDTIGFDTVTGLTLEAIQSVENKTQGWVYNTAGATVATTSIKLDLTKQESGYPAPLSTDEFEIVYRDASRLTDASQKSQIVDGSGNVIAAVSNALKVDLASDNTGGVEAVQITASDLNMTEASASDIKTAVELIDDAVYTDGAGTPSKGILVMGNDGTNPQALSCNTDGELKINLETADIEIGAVEIKDASSDVRVEVSAANTGRTTASNVLSVQAVDAAGAVLSTDAVIIASGAITETNSAALAVVGGGAEATAQRVTIADDSTGVITVDTAILETTDLDGATAPTAGSDLDVSAHSMGTYHITTASVDTNVTVKIQSSLDGTNYVDLSTSVITTDTTTEISIENRKYKYVRANWTAETGGTAAVVTVKSIWGS